MSLQALRGLSASQAGKIGRIAEAAQVRLRCAGALSAPPILRIALAVPFFKSGLTRWDGFLSLSPSAAYLFENLFKLHILGGEYSFPAPIVVAYLVGTAEIALPILLVLGLGTRFVALALLLMVGVIQLTVPDGWANFHLPWASMTLAIMALGPGRLSLDRLIVIVAERSGTKTRESLRSAPPFEQPAPPSFKDDAPTSSDSSE